MYLNKTLCGVLVIVALGAGCQKPDAASDSPPQETSAVRVDEPLQVLVLDDQPLADILQREWRARSEQTIEFKLATTSDFVSQLDAGLSRLETDVIIFPSALLGQLVDRLRPSPQDLMKESKYGYTEIHDLIRRRELRWKRQPYAVSFGSPAFVLLRRTDLVPDAPNTWEELASITETLRDSSTITPLIQPLADGWAAKLLLARAASYLYDANTVSSVFEFSTMEPRISNPAFVRAANELADSVGESRFDFTPAGVLEEFIAGKAAMAITWPGATTVESPDTLEFPVAVSTLPGAAREGNNSEAFRATVFGIDGCLGAVSRNAKNARLANIFLAWATGPEQSGKLCPRSSHSAPFRKRHLSDAKQWISPAFPAEVATSYYHVVEEILQRAQAFQCPRLPGQHRYMASLDNAVHEVLENSDAASLILTRTAEKWKAITKEIGFEEQKAAYAESLGIEVQ